MTPARFTSEELQTRRQAARRTAFVIAGVALAVYLGFLWLGISGH